MKQAWNRAFVLMQRVNDGDKWCGFGLFELLRAKVALNEYFAQLDLQVPSWTAKSDKWDNRKRKAST
jgi:hypothetical protein